MMDSLGVGLGEFVCFDLVIPGAARSIYKKICLGFMCSVFVEVCLCYRYEGLTRYIIYGAGS